MRCSMKNYSKSVSKRRLIVSVDARYGDYNPGIDVLFRIEFDGCED